MTFDEKLVLKILNTCLSTGGDLAELYYQDNNTHAYTRRYKKVHAVTSSKICGVGLRILKDKKYVYGYTSDLSDNSLLKLAKSLAEGFEGKQEIKALPLKEKKHGNLNPIKISHDSWDTEKKIAYLKKGEDAAFAKSEQVQNVTTSLFEQDEHVEIYNSKGLYVEDERVRTRLMISVIASDGSNLQGAYDSRGLSCGLELLENTDFEALAVKTTETAIALLTAEDAPSGEWPVVLGNGVCGVLFHEACGHPLEGSNIYLKTSPFTGKIKQAIATDVVSAHDNGTIPNGWGTENVDDEGYEPTDNILIKDGILENYMVDEFTSRSIENTHPTGSCRRENYRYPPTTRMTNTYICNGASTPEEIIASVKDGIYCRDFSGGQVDPTTDQFVFTSTTAYRIKDGKIQNILKPISLMGYGYEILKRITMVANDGARAPGTCGASSGSCEVEVGQPTLLVSSILVGGTGGE